MATLVLKKPTPGDFFISDVGVTVPGSGQDTYTDDGLIRKLSSSRILRDAVAAGTIVVNDGVQDLTADQGAAYLTELWQGVGFSTGQGAITLEFGNTGGVPVGGSVGLLSAGNTSAGARMMRAGRITSASIQVNAADGVRNYNLSIRVNGVEVATVALAIGTTGNHSAALSVAVAAGDAVTAFMVRTSGAGASTFTQMHAVIQVS